ncbi:hypothetical protein [Hymenobacter cellulosivorans]|uniref:DUF4840 domain-containing protein n=1 Tax=Hymenobacter cellulosivorans TaxID=2932249 RepID=A0ABY4FFB8_9BACT|nr:hypothetical protein [Hymenobacter cellulosivorans]UOQ54717.1 hypothetical protein MUN80_08150 [Hymenobacter cellulosivorans]
MKLIASLGWAALLLTAAACSREKVPVQEVEVRGFSRSPKSSSPADAVKMILGQVNDQQARQATGQEEVTQLGLEQEDGSVEVPHLANTDYLVVTNDSTLQQVLEAQGPGAAPDSIDFKREFVVLLIHPPVAFTGTTFLDNVEAEVEEDTVVRLTLSSVTMPAVDMTGGLGYGQYDYKVRMYKLPRKSFQKARIVFEKQDDTPEVYVPL